MPVQERRPPSTVSMAICPEFISNLPCGQGILPCAEHDTPYMGFPIRFPELVGLDKRARKTCDKDWVAETPHTASVRFGRVYRAALSRPSSYPSNTPV